MIDSGEPDKDMILLWNRGWPKSQRRTCRLFDIHWLSGKAESMLPVTFNGQARDNDSDATEAEISSC